MSDWSVKGVLTLDTNELNRQLHNSKGQINRFATDVKNISGKQGIFGNLFSGSAGDSGITGLLGTFKSSVLKIVGGLGAITGIFALWKKYTSETEKIFSQSKMLGVDVNSFAAMNKMTEKIGLNVEDLFTSLAKLSEFFKKAIKDVTSEEANLLNYLKINPEQLSQKNLIEQFITLAQAIKGVNNETIRMAIARDVFGRSSMEVLELISKYGDLKREFEKTVFSTNAKDFEYSDKMIDSLREILSFWKEIGRTVFSGVSKFIMTGGFGEGEKPQLTEKRLQFIGEQERKKREAEKKEFEAYLNKKQRDEDEKKKQEEILKKREQLQEKINKAHAEQNKLIDEYNEGLMSIEEKYNYISQLIDEEQKKLEENNKNSGFTLDQRIETENEIIKLKIKQNELQKHIDKKTPIKPELFSHSPTYRIGGLQSIEPLMKPIGFEFIFKQELKYLAEIARNTKQKPFMEKTTLLK